MSAPNGLPVQNPFTWNSGTKEFSLPLTNTVGDIGWYDFELRFYYDGYADYYSIRPFSVKIINNPLDNCDSSTLTVSSYIV